MATEGSSVNAEADAEADAESASGEELIEERDVVSNGREVNSSPSNGEAINPAGPGGGGEMRLSPSNGDDVDDDTRPNKESTDQGGGGGGVTDKGEPFVSGGGSGKEAPPTSDDEASPISTSDDARALNGGRGVVSDEPPTIEVEVVVEGGVSSATPISPLSATPLSPIPSSSEKISMSSVYNYKAEGKDPVNIYLPGLPVIADISSNLTSNRSRGPQFVISLEHGVFNWKVYKFYTDFLALRRTLAPLRFRIRLGSRGRGRKRGYLPHLLTVNDINPLQITRTQNQLPKCRKFLNAILNDREFRSHPFTLKFLEVSRLSFVEDLGSKLKEGLITKRSGGHRRVTNFLGCTSCCICKCSVWRQRWLVLKDSYLLYMHAVRNTVAGVLLFDQGTHILCGSIQTGILFGLQIVTKTRKLLVRCPSRKIMREWRDAISRALSSDPGRLWAMEKRFLSFAPPRENCTVQWFVDGEIFMSQVANALLAAKEEIYITDWMISPQIYLKRSEDKSTLHNLNFRLDKILLRKANEGVKVFIQLYKEVTVAIFLGSEYARAEFKHPNIVVYRHPEHIQTGVYKWAHHEKIVAIDQTLAFVGGIDLAFGRYDNHCHQLSDKGYTVDIKGDSDATMSYKWPGKDLHNPFFRDIEKHHEPFEDDLDRNIEPRMPWHDVASCVFGSAARDVARHFIQRYNFTRHEQSTLDHFLLPRGEFCSTDHERSEFQYLSDVLYQRHTSVADVQVLRSVDQWSAGTTVEHSILNAYLETIDKAQHFIYIENQFFISSLKEVRNTIVDALRARITRAYKKKETFRVIIVMPLLPSFNGDLADSTGNVPKSIVHWNYKTFSRGEDSLIAKLTTEDGVPAEEVANYISMYGLRTFGMIEDKLVTEIVYVHSKCMIVDDRYTIIGSANINDRSMLGERDSEMAIYVEDKEMIQGRMNGSTYSVGKFAHSLRCRLFKEHLGLLKEQRRYCAELLMGVVGGGGGGEEEQREELSVMDPACESFYISWCSIAATNMDIFEKVFAGRNIPTDSVKTYNQYRSFKDSVGLAETDPAVAKKLLSRLQGFLVPMPLHFLSEEDLLPPFGAVESILSELFT